MTKVEEPAVLAWARLIRASQALLWAVEAELKAAGLPPLPWYDVLLELRRATPHGLRPVELQGRTLLAQYNLSRLADRLVKAGHVQRAPCTDDARGHVLKITASGRALLKRMWPVYEAAIAEHFASHLDPAETEALAVLLAKLPPFRR